MKIEKMQLRDIEQVAKLAEQLGYPNTSERMAERFLKIEKLPNHILFVAKENDVIMGFAHAHREPETLLADPRVELHALVVDEAHRGKRIGHLLVAKVEEWARSQGVKLIRLRSNTKREAAHRFYQREGYSQPKSWHLFVKEL